MRIKFLAVLLLACLFLGGCDLDTPNNGAPVATVSARQAWAEKEFRHLWEHTETWIAKSELIAETIGEIQYVAPIGKPNEKFYSFSESWADMNLEVVGTKGQGTLLLKSVHSRWSQGTQVGNFTVGFHEGIFESAQRKEIICTSGKGYLAEFKVDTLYNQLLTYPASDNPNDFLNLWELFQKLVISTFPQHQSPMGMHPPLQGLLIYRKPLLLKRAELLDGWGLKNEAVLAYQDVIKVCIKDIQYEIWAKSPDQTTVASNLDVALESLQAANKLDPGNKEILKLARQRLDYQWRSKECQLENCKSRQCESGCCKSGQGNNLFFRAAAKEVKSIGYLKRELGRFRICDEASDVGNVQIDKKGRYYANVKLKLDGTWDDGTVQFRFRECGNQPPVDLFAKNPRRPKLPLEYWSPRWESDSGEKVKIGARTGEPL